jgi:RimJ/RimL family protein N-acetyltransferase
MLPDRFETTRLILRPIEREDAPAIFTGYAQDPEVVRFLIWRPHQGLAETEAYIARCMAAAPDRDKPRTRLTSRASREIPAVCIDPALGPLPVSGYAWLSAP